MIQGTTPTLKLHVPMGTDAIVEAEFTLNDYVKNVRTWKLSDMEKSGDCLVINLSETDTLELSAKLHRGQLRLKLNTGDIIASNVFSVMVKDLLSEVKL